MSRKREWKVRGIQGARAVEMVVMAPSHAAARRAAVGQGIGPRDVVLSEPAGVMRRKAIKAFALLKGN